MQKTEIATLFFEDISFPNTGNPNIKKIVVPIDRDGVHTDPLWLPD